MFLSGSTVKSVSYKKDSIAKEKKGNIMSGKIAIRGGGGQMVGPKKIPFLGHFPYDISIGNALTTRHIVNQFIFH